MSLANIWKFKLSLKALILRIFTFICFLVFSNAFCRTKIFFTSLLSQFFLNSYLSTSLGWRQFISREYDSTHRRSWYFQQEQKILSSIGWLGSSIWMTLVSYIDCLSQPIREEYSPSFFTCQLLPLIIINHPLPRNNYFLSSSFSFHPQTTMPQRVNMCVKAKNHQTLIFKKRY